MHTQKRERVLKSSQCNQKALKKYKISGIFLAFKKGYAENFSGQLHKIKCSLLTAGKQWELFFKCLRIIHGWSTILLWVI